MEGGLGEILKYADKHNGVTILVVSVAYLLIRFVLVPVIKRIFDIWENNRKRENDKTDKYEELLLGKMDTMTATVTNVGTEIKIQNINHKNLENTVTSGFEQARKERRGISTALKNKLDKKDFAKHQEEFHELRNEVQEMKQNK